MSLPSRAQKAAADRVEDRSSLESTHETSPAAQRALPALRVVPFPAGPQPRRFVRVPTHAVGAHPEQREYPRATLKLPLKLRSVDGVKEEFPVTLVTRDISSSGAYFLCPRELRSGTIVELEIVLVGRPMGRGNVVLVSEAVVCRSEPAATPGWFGVAATFPDFALGRDDTVPSRFHFR